VTSALVALYLLLSLAGPPIEGHATWYGADYHGNYMANGDTFDMNNTETIAVNLKSPGNPAIRLGTWLLVCNPDNVCLMGEVRDTGYFPDENLDLSLGMYRLLGNPDGRPFATRYWKVERSDYSH
jgi:hypothetical protein